MALELLVDSRVVLHLATLLTKIASILLDRYLHLAPVLWAPGRVPSGSSRSRAVDGKSTTCHCKAEVGVIQFLNASHWKLLAFLSDSRRHKRLV